MFKTKFQLRIITAMLFALLLGCTTPAMAAVKIKQSYARISATAGETLATGDVVCLKDADGKSYKADADDATLRPAVGIVGKGGGSGATVEIIVQGVVSGYTSLSEGALGYLSGTAGAVTQVAPAWNQPIGVATSTTTYYFNYSNYVDTSAITALGTLTQALVMEGSTADDFETTVAVQDPTADNTITVPDDGGMLLTSTLATNGQEVANSIWGASNGLMAEGATANAFETFITFTDPTADRTVTVPDATGTMAMTAGVGSYRPYALDTDNVVLTTADCGEVHAIATDAKTYTLPATAAGCSFTFINAGAAGNNIVELIPAAGDQVFGTVTLAASVVVINGAAAEHILNTKVSSQRGDSLTLIGDGADGWYITSSTGIWAEATP